MSTRNISWGGKGGRCVGLTTLPPFMSWNLGASTSWNPQGLLRPVTDCFSFTLYLHNCRANAYEFPFRNMSSFDDRTANRTGANIAVTASTLAHSLYVRTAEKISTKFRPAVSKNVARKNKCWDTEEKIVGENFPIYGTVRRCGPNCHVTTLVCRREPVTDVLNLVKHFCRLLTL